MFRDLVRYTFWDETSQFDPNGRWVGGAEYYEREYVCYLPARLIRRAPELIDEFIAKYSEEDWIWGAIPESGQEMISFSSVSSGRDQ